MSSTEACFTTEMPPTEARSVRSQGTLLILMRGTARPPQLATYMPQRAGEMTHGQNNAQHNN
jgi:hypothetical protein